MIEAECIAQEKDVLETSQTEAAKASRSAFLHIKTAVSEASTINVPELNLHQYVRMEGPEVTMDELLGRA